jgi:hypothetical protein
MANYGTTSPYYSTIQTNGYLNIIDFRNIPPSNDDTLFELTKKYEYRPDMLAYDLYGSSELWWIFSVRNSEVILDPIFDMTAGLKIYLPSLSTLKITLGI